MSDPRRRFLCPEVVQSSAMDCGPAALQALAAGCGLELGYARLREACRTEVDGTSIDALEELARRVGLDATQLMVRPDALLERGAGLLPAIVVVQLEGGLLHFVVAWRRLGPFVQVMDPAIGRRWLRCERFREELFVHDHLLARSEWDAAQAAAPAAERPDLEVRPASPDPRDGTPRVALRGAVLVAVRGRRATAGETLPPELARAVGERPPRPWRTLAAIAWQRAPFATIGLGLAALLAAAGGLAEGFVLNALLEIGRDLAAPLQRAAAGGLLLALLAALLLLEAGLASGVQRSGRALEAEVRTRFHAKIARLEMRWFSGRPLSDLAERGHALALLRELPLLAVELLRGATTLLFAAGALAWLAPALALPAAIAAVVALLVPLLFAPALAERDLRLRTHAGVLARFVVDALQGLAPIRAHAAEATLEREHERLLGEWSRSAHRHLGVALAMERSALAIGLLAAGFLLARFARGGGAPNQALLVAWWALALPAAGAEMARALRRLPALRSVVLRLLEPLTAPERDDVDHAGGAPASANGQASASANGAAPAAALSAAPTCGVALRFEGVSVAVGGHLLLRDVDLAVAAGEAVAIVGASGAGKSSLLALLLGFHRASSGRITVDGGEFDAAAVAALRRATAWVDPTVELWNESLLDNLLYGHPADRSVDAATLAADADLKGLLAALPDGLLTPLGERGGLVSGGEGQRVRFGRALATPAPRLVLLDEPFRGLGSEQRRRLLATARARFRGATLLFVSHDLAAAADFPRVLVVDDGRIVEDGAPAELEQRADGRFHALRAAEAALRDELFGREFRHVALEGGVLREEVAP
ncbi:MAG: ATP-binding cassette domain-containing protein [Planctomycetes bacterium]|nr:ATP-binding cassette domain-containing protein [Planctomycetota bacterium]